MPAPVTKIFLSSSNLGVAGYRLMSSAPTDFSSMLAAGTASAPWLAGISDVNGDGVSEIITGVAFDDDKDVDAGRIFVTFGRATGGAAETLGTGVTSFIIDGVSAGDHAGSSVGSVTDLNGDGKAEILIGASGMDNGAVLDAGAAFVLWGKATTGGIDLGDPFTGGGKGYVMKGEAAGDHVGGVMTSIADLNGDGKAEILVGAPDSDGAKVDAGAAYVVWGKSTSSAVNLSNVAAGVGGFKILGEGKNEHAGSALGVLSDVSGDGKSEILIGASTSEAGGQDSGAAYVVFGKSTTTTVDLQNVASGVGGYRITGQLGENAGDAIAGLSDINGDGIADILVGASGGNRAYVVYGKSTTSEVLLSDIAAGIGGFVITPEAGHSLVGLSVAKGGDFNRDGINDFIIGTPHDSEGGADAGAVYVVWGGVSGAIDLTNVANGVGGAKIVGVAGSLTGSTVSALTDMNGDATPDLLIGSPGSSYESASIVYAPISWQPDNNIYGTSGNDVMGAGYGVLHTIGAGNDAILGLAGNDTINGEGGNDTLEGGVGVDSLVGGVGNDTYLVDNVGDVVVENVGEGTDTVIASVNYTLLGLEVEVLQLVGSAHVGTGNAQDNIILGTIGADTIDGAAGVDTLNGGAGNDTYKVDNAGDGIVEIVGGGTDTVLTSIDFSLADQANVENLTLIGTAHVGTGNNSNNAIIGTATGDTLDGGAGVDTLSGGLGNDTYLVDSATDSIVEAVGGGSDSVISTVNYTLGVNVENLSLSGLATVGIGNVLNNVITSTASNDTLDGGVGVDTLIGGAGNDRYIVDNAGDRVQEAAGEGSDTVFTSVNLTLADNVEALQLTGSAHVGTGNALDNSIAGTAGADTLDGGVGVDTMVGGAGDDTYMVDGLTDAIVEGVAEGSDTVIAAVDYTLSNNLENLVLIGDAHAATGNASDNGLTGDIGNDTLMGAAGNDTLDGGVGSNVMIGGVGDDTYIVNGMGDVIVEDVGGGTDTVWVNTDWTISDNIESVQLTGGVAHLVVGNAVDNHIAGSTGDDTIDGGEGNDLESGGDGDDRLISASGLDTLVGGSGDDRFVLKGGSAYIEDFLGHDTVDASEAIGDSYIDLTGDTHSTVEGGDCDLGAGGSTALPLDVQFLQDLSGSFGDDIATVRGLVPSIVSALQAVQTNSEFGSSTFVDKPTGSFGSAGDWVYNTLLGLSPDSAALTAAYNSMVIHSGNDEPEAQIEALMQLALHSADVGFRADSARFVVLFTDAPFHQAGDGASAGITTANNGDAIMDGTPAGTGEDYPLISQLKDALMAANIIPIFAIANNYESIYQGLVDTLGRGAVVTLSPNSANVVSAITAGLFATTVTHIEDAVGGAGNDTITGNDVANHLMGNEGNDNLSSAAGDDTLIGGGGNDSLISGLGDDAFYYSNNAKVEGYDVVVGGDGVDVIHAKANNTYIGLSSFVGIETISSDGFTNVHIRASSGVHNWDFSGVTLSGIASIDMGNGIDSVIGSVNADMIKAYGGNDDVAGGGGDDKLYGGLGDDLLKGETGRDRIYGEDGADTLVGGADNDLLSGGVGNDSFLFGNAKLAEGYDSVDGGDGIDVIVATQNDTYIGLASVAGIEEISAGVFTGVAIRGNSAAQNFDFSTTQLTGISFIDVGSGNDTVTGSIVADTIKGQAGVDVINGDAGKDLIYGGMDGDSLTGGADADKFIVSKLEESTVAHADMIFDFSHAQKDKIYVNLLDADSGAAGDQAFHFVGGAAFSGVAGELRFEDDGMNTHVTGDVNGDGSADFQIDLVGVMALVIADFSL